MRPRLRSKLFLTFAAVALFACLSLHHPYRSISGDGDEDEDGDFLSANYLNAAVRPSSRPYSLALLEDESSARPSSHIRRVSSVDDAGNQTPASERTVAVLLADWEVLVLAGDDRSEVEVGNVCLFQNNATSPARFSGSFPAGNRAAFKCVMPNSVRRLRPFYMPILTKLSEEYNYSAMAIKPRELYRWTFLAYDSFSTENDVVLFVKGVNNRQGINRSPSEFKCVFQSEESNAAVKTAVSSSSQEVFRCETPDLTAFGSVTGEAPRISVTLEITAANNLAIPSVARYVPRRTLAGQNPKSLLCASAMVYNAGKFLREWVTYHSRIGVEKFLLYDNDSNDNLNDVVSELNDEGFNVTTTFWIWPKTQEAGFSHAAVHGNDSCTWMMYVDVDEFIFSPSWTNSSQPSITMLKSLLPRPDSDPAPQTGQISIRCNEFGPSGQRSHPAEGVTQGYTCRRSMEQRHKSIVLLEAVDPSLLNVVHHFLVRTGPYIGKTLSMNRAVVNHYKYQAWAEFRNKFRRRVSAYVVDWTEKVNPGSKDRTPGLGFEPVKPEGWDRKFCEVRDERLKMLTRRWFGSSTSDGYKMAWQR